MTPKQKAEELFDRFYSLTETDFMKKNRVISKVIFIGFIVIWVIMVIIDLIIKL